MTPPTCSLPGSHARARKSRLPWLAAALAAVYWGLESALHHLFHVDGGGSFAAALWPADTDELLMRGAIVALILGFGLHSRRRLEREQDALDALNRVLESTTDAFVTVDHQWRITTFGQQAQTLFARTRDEVLGHSIWDALPAAAPYFRQALTAARVDGTLRLVSAYCAACDRHLEVRAIPHALGLSLYFRDLSERHRYERELERRNARLQAILDSAVDGIVSIDQQGIIESFNRAAEQIFGYQADEVVGRNITVLMGADEARHHDAHMATYLRTGVSHIIDIGPREVTARRKDGTTFPMDLAVGEMRRDEERHFVGVVRDITDRKRAEQALRHSEASLARAQSIARLGSWDWDIAAAALHWSDEVYRIFGYAPQSFPATYEGFLARVHPEDRALVVAAVDQALHTRGHYDAEHRLVRPDGTYRIVREQGEVTCDEEGRPVSMIGTVHDITERVEAQQRIEFMANFDPLTGLPNRSLLQYRLEQGLLQARRDADHTALLFVGIDRFKNVNDTLGHRAGDQVLRTFAGRLRQAVRAGDTVGRLGSDEFAVVLFGLKDVDGATQVVRHIQALTIDPIAVDEAQEVVVSVCLGLTLFPHDGADAETLFRNADTALHRAKHDGPGNYQFFTADMTAESQARMRLEQDLRRALEREEFELFYQPQVELSGGRVIGAEALLRWRHPERGLVSPAHFVPVLEETGLIVAVGQWVIRRACRQSKDWQNAGLPPLRVAVNLSAIQFRQHDLVQSVRAILAETALAPTCLELEITEGLLVENVEQTIGLLLQLHDMGIRISIDDFGTGYSSMSYLQRFPVHTLKLDRSFVNHVHDDEGSASIAKAVIALAHSLHLRVIAEGIEIAEQAAFLRRHHCDEAQGFYFAKPMPAGEIPLWLASAGRPLVAPHEAPQCPPAVPGKA